MADILSMEPPAPSTGQASNEAAAEAARYSRTGDMLKNRMSYMVKGAGYIGTGNQALSDPGQILTKAHQATMELRTETNRGYTNKTDVVKNLNPQFLSQFGNLKTALTAPSVNESLQQIVTAIGNPDLTRSFTAGNLGIGTVSGLVPFDLLAPSRLIYPMYTVFRNKLPRPAGQGTSRIERVFTGISGTQTGGQGVVDISIPELVQSGGSLASTSWPLNLPSAGSQTEVQLNVPYRFFGLTESLSWLAQFAGQGFEDISALANLILLQEMMLGEEYAMLAASSTALATPGTPTAAVRTAGSNETAFNTTITAVKVVASNYYGTTATSAASSGFTVSAGQVVDVTFPAMPAGGQSWNIYGYDGTSYYLMASGVGGTKYTLQGFGTLPATVTPPAADTGTGSGTRMEGLIPTLTGKSATSGIYPSNWQGGYVNSSVGQHLNYSVLYTALQNLWDGQTGSNNPGSFRADPGEIVGEGGDIMRLSNDVISQGAATNYRLFLEQSEVPGVRVGAAVSEFQNPITRSILKLVVHPWLTQGTAMLMSYQLPQTWTNVANAWEMTMVQDYVSIAWPVIDATFRYSIFMFGALVAHAPQYSGILQGLQVSDTTPFS
jgi:hypothetical protein